MTSGAHGHRFTDFTRRHGHGDVTLHRLRHTVATVLVSQGRLLHAEQRFGHRDLLILLWAVGVGAKPSPEPDIDNARLRHGRSHRLGLVGRCTASRHPWRTRPCSRRPRLLTSARCRLPRLASALDLSRALDHGDREGSREPGRLRRWRPAPDQAGIVAERRAGLTRACRRWPGGRQGLENDLGRHEQPVGLCHPADRNHTGSVLAGG